MRHAHARRTTHQPLAFWASLLAAAVLLVGSPSGADAFVSKYLKRKLQKLSSVRDSSIERVHPIRMWRSMALTKAKTLTKPLAREIAGIRELVRAHQAKRAEQKESKPVATEESHRKVPRALLSLLPHLSGRRFMKRALLTTLIMGLLASHAAAGSAIFGWLYDHDYQADAFMIYAHTGGGYDYSNPLWRGPGDLRRATILGFLNDRKYYFVMRAAGDGKVSADSEELTLDLSDGTDTSGPGEAPDLEPPGISDITNLDSHVSIGGSSGFGD